MIVQNNDLLDEDVQCAIFVFYHHIIFFQSQAYSLSGFL